MRQHDRSSEVMAGCGFDGVEMTGGKSNGNGFTAVCTLVGTCLCNDGVGLDGPY